MKHIPNILSVLRVALIPFFIWQMTADEPFAAAMVLLVSGLTDFLDGLLARKFGWTSALGKILDPAADKLTQVAVCIMMAIKLYRFWPFFAALLFKDFVMLVLGGALVKKGVRIEGAKWFGKVVTCLFYAVMLLILLFPQIPEKISVIMLSVTACCAFIAGAMYIPEYLRYRKNLHNEESETQQNTR